MYSFVRFFRLPCASLCYTLASPSSGEELYHCEETDGKANCYRTRLHHEYPCCHYPWRTASLNLYPWYYRFWQNDTHGERCISGHAQRRRTVLHRPEGRRHRCAPQGCS